MLEKINATDEVTEERTNAAKEKEDSDKSADFRKMLKKIMFLYLAVLNGWQIQQISTNKFQMTKMWK